MPASTDVTTLHDLPRPKNPSLSGVVPAYNEGDSLGPMLSVLVFELERLGLQPPPAHG